MTAPALIRRFVVAFLAVSGLVLWVHGVFYVAEQGLTWQMAAIAAAASIGALIWIGPDIIRAAGRR